jgi:hypothetical protein
MNYFQALQLFTLFKDHKLKYHQLLNLKLYSQFSNLASKGGTGWWLENHFVSP